MKNQYFGDINDYRKYGLIRILSAELSTTFCWMLTPDDPRPDGHRIHYLYDPSTWRKYDPEVYDFLYDHVIENKTRRVSSLESSNLLTNCSFFNKTIDDNPSNRSIYLKNLLKFADSSSLIFFDPDNGIEVKSVPFGRKRCSKYLYFTEIQKTYQAGHSILIYQHLPPKPRLPLVNEISRKLKDITEIKQIFVYWTQFVVFILLPQLEHKRYFTSNNVVVNNNWKDQIVVKCY
jgi:hypothetical protein